MKPEECEPNQQPNLWLNILCFCWPWLVVAARFVMPDTQRLGLNAKNPLSQLVDFLNGPWALLLQCSLIFLTPLVVLARSKATLRAKVAARCALAGCGCNTLGLIGLAIFIATTFKGCC